MQTLTTERVEQFLFREAALLDDSDFHPWLALFTPDVEYRVPVRAVRERGGPAGQTDFSGRAHYFWEDLGTLRTRVMRLESEFAWAESPRTRTRRFVGNVRLAPGQNLGQGLDGDELQIRDNLAVYCYRGDAPAPIVLTGEREETLRVVDGKLRIGRRVVRLDSTVLGLQSLSIFL